MLAGDKLPVVVLTGFLGSGKTTLLNAALSHPDFANSAVVVNEFGEIGLDHLLVSSAKENILLLDAGCLCCVVLDSLRETLADLYHRRVRGEAPPFERVLIETTGLAEPAPILRSLMRDDLITAFYRFSGLVCLVDAVFGEETLQQHHEAMAQAAMADRLVVTKTDLTGGEIPASLLETLATVNPVADIQRVAPDRMEPQRLLEFPAGSAPRMRFVAEEVRHDAAVQAQSYFYDADVTRAGLASWFEVLRRRHGADLLRVKGIVRTDGRPVLVDGVQGLFQTRRLDAWPDDERRSRLVVIGKGLDRDFLQQSLGWLSSPEGSLPPGSDDEIRRGPPSDMRP